MGNRTSVLKFMNGPALNESIVPEFILMMIAYIFDQSWAFRNCQD